MNTSEFAGRVTHIRLSEIEASPDNPRGTVQTDASFERLVSSIDEVGILVPLVVRRRPSGKYQLVDGERRFLAAHRLRLGEVPAHVIQDTHPESLRKYMFHLHMTREQWVPLAQCKALAEMYPQLDAGIKFSEKSEWVERIANETWMNVGTARDRIHVLAWPRGLKEKIYSFNSRHTTGDIYSYVLAIEVSIVEPSVLAFPRFYDHGAPVERRANAVRHSLLDKTIAGIEDGEVSSRDQIREVSPLFQRQLNSSQQKIAVTIFQRLIESDEYLYDEARAEIETRLPELVAEKPPKPQKLIGTIKSLTETLKMYKADYVEASIKRQAKREEIKGELFQALANLAKAALTLKDKL
ncbi:MAG TPA: ParB N-terminal domain-containing protein [Terriglobia bacterium]|nr:ParB N-terminal domain-containing protein [Terriglobia bacterium]